MVGVARIVLEAPLPPLVNPLGVVLEGERTGTELEGTQVSGAVLDVVSAGTVVSGLRIHGGQAGLVVRARGVTLRNLSVVDSDTGVLIGEGAADTSIVDAVFARNRIGVQIAASSGKTTLRNSRFEDHLAAGVWAAAPVAPASIATTEIAVVDNRFHNDAAGVVVVNVTALIERNVFDEQKGSAIHASDTRVALVGNRIRGGHGFGIYAERLFSGFVSGNEITRNCAGGILMRRVNNTRVVANQIYQNGYGTVMMQGSAQSPNTVADNLIIDHVGDGIVLIAASPIVTRNRVLRNHLAGLRLSTMDVGSGTAPTPAPLLTGNVFQGNGRDEPQRDKYNAKVEPTATSQALADCGWRIGASPMYAMQAAAVH
jgi:hypothetical protein